jgi:hypothetical protein
MLHGDALAGLHCCEEQQMAVQSELSCACSMLPHHRPIRSWLILSPNKYIVSVGKHFGTRMDLGSANTIDGLQIPVSLRCHSYL